MTSRMLGYGSTRTAGSVAIVACLLAIAGCTGRTGSPDETTAAPTTVESATPRTFVPDPPPEGTTVCDPFMEPVALSSVESTALTETSGIVASRTHEGVYWLHDDSGGAAAIYAIDASGRSLGTWVLDGVTNLDWEDIAIGPGPDPAVDYLYVGDIGDNLAFRPDVSVHRFAEPDPTVDGVVTEVATQRFGYPGPPIDAEALAVDAVNGDLVLVTKTDTGRPTVLVAPTMDFGAQPIAAFIEIATLDLGPGAFVTALDISRDGTLVAARGYDEVWLWARIDVDLAAAFAAPPCAAPSPVEIQGEALAIRSDGGAYVTVSEGTSPTLWEVGR